MAMYERSTIRSAILACEDTCFHVPEGLVPMVRRVSAWLPEVSIRRCEHQRLEYSVRNGDCTSLGCADIYDTIRSRDAEWTESKATHTGSYWREKQMTIMMIAGRDGHFSKGQNGTIKITKIALRMYRVQHASSEIFNRCSSMTKPCSFRGHGGLSA